MRPVPYNFRQTAVREGDKAIERRYGVGNDTIVQWKVACGLDQIRSERQAVQPCGRKCGGRR